MASMKQWTVTTPHADFGGLKFEEVPVPGVGDREVLVRFHASSLNYRDVAIAKVLLPSATTTIDWARLLTNSSLFIGHVSLRP